MNENLTFLKFRKMLPNEAGKNIAEFCNGNELILVMRVKKDKTDKKALHMAKSTKCKYKIGAVLPLSPC